MSRRNVLVSVAQENSPAKKRQVRTTLLVEAMLQRRQFASLRVNLPKAPTSRRANVNQMLASCIIRGCGQAPAQPVGRT